MKTLALDNFKGGMDRRKRLSAKTPNIWLLKDGKVLSNGDWALRDYFRHCVSLTQGNGRYCGLFASEGALHTFYSPADDFSGITKSYWIGQPDGSHINLYVHPLVLPTGTSIERIVFCRQVSGYLYVIARVAGGNVAYLHFWLVDDAPKWQPDTVYDDGDVVRPTAGFNGWRYTASPLDDTSSAVPFAPVMQYSVGDLIAPSDATGWTYKVTDIKVRANDPAPPPAPPPGGGGGDGGGGGFQPPGGGGGWPPKRQQ